MKSSMRAGRVSSFGAAAPMVALVIALVIALAVAVLPFGSLVVAAILRSGAAATEPVIDSPLRALLLSALWAASAAFVGVLVAWPASRAFRASVGGVLESPFVRLASALVIAPVVLPPWLLYAAGWMCCGPGTAVGDFCERRDLVSALRLALLALALVVWSTALAFAVFATLGPRPSASDQRLLALDRAGPLARARAALARDGRALLIAWLAPTVFLLCETTVFDLSQVGSFGFELRSLDSLGASPATVVRAALPMIALLVVAVACMPRLARKVGDAGLRARGPSLALPSQRVGLGLVLAAVPAAVTIAAMVRIELAVPRAGDFVTLHGRAFASTVFVALAAALVSGTLAASIRVLLDGPGARAARIAALVLLVIGLLPATVVALGISLAYNRPLLGPVYDSAAVLVVALAARALPVAVLVPVALAARESQAAARLRMIDARDLPTAWICHRREIGAAFMGASAIAFAWSLGELTASGRLAPPGFPWLATDILNAIHYQRPDTVVLATAGILIAALPAAGILMAIIRRGGARLAGVPLLALAALSVATAGGCGERPGAMGATATPAEDDALMAALRQTAPIVDRPLATDLELAGVGRGKGQFNGPRVLAVDGADGSCYVIDKDARVQRFGPDGAAVAEWRMPKWDRGKPTGASIAPDGTLVVADTHEHRLVAYSKAGEILWTLGEYGSEPGQFIYPTDIVFLPDGCMLVSEYGGYDRIQCFGPDRRFLWKFGSSGNLDGQFLRPQSMAYDAARDELFVADAGNHRIQVFSARGEFRRAFGKPGTEPGELNYPFGVVLLERAGRRSIVVAEHSNHRIQELDALTGESLLVCGGIGLERGRLKYPWALEPVAPPDAGGAVRLAVCDHGNSRVQFFTWPAGVEPRGASEKPGD